jgi:GWxTD domain-containing protein
MEVILLFANIALAQHSFTPQPFAPNPISQQAAFHANQFASNAPFFFTKSLPAKPVSPADDESKKIGLRLNSPVPERLFLVDYANFIASPLLTLVEFYVQVGYDRLTFTREGNFFRAIYDVDFYIEDQQGNLLQTQSAYDEVKANTYGETTTPNNFRITLLSFYLRPGDYRFRAIVTDKETGKEYEIASQFSVRDFSGQNLALSDLQFSRNICVDSSASVFVKHNRRVEPNVARAYGEFVGQLFLYYEIYNLSAPNSATTGDSTVMQTAAADSFRTVFIVRNENGDEVKQLWKSGRKPGSSCVQSVVLPIVTLPSGAYTLMVRVFDNASGYYTEATGRFRVQWDLLSFKDKKFEEILELMRYVGGKDELEQLAKLPEADRQRGLLDFWQRRDPTPGTPQNEAMDEYYRRINYANAHFKCRGGEGWESPQGETYVIYGPPDNVRRYASLGEARTPESWGLPARPAGARREFSSPFAVARPSFINKPYEVWEYTRLNRSFVFVDLHGVGVYELVDPSLLNSWGSQ